ncbi:hypothetical protein IHC87_06860 [Photobacterium damselae subsp. damselae]|uniref:hypothetical protein n=1 Tax=Photobacterium damselae TaxID=38293 RepID=UPI001F40FB78|nr:hypothetical protein [Photobacterium damselae]UJZ95060.1 hypothetical protein IHC87_06860 [Photobacterium damselae subsp. damselae]UJZ99041.1 hypothetical protein IHC88_06850 [Photobacterium damselae subsp. damselae]
MFTVKDLNTPEMQALDKYGIAILNNTYTHDKQIINAAIKLRQVVVRDRIEASRWCKDELGFQSDDGIIAGQASNVLAFGTLKGDLTLDEKGNLIGQLDVIETKSLAVDYIVDNFEYDDFIMLALLMGKPSPSPEYPIKTSEQSQNASQTNALE